MDKESHQILQKNFLFAELSAEETTLLAQSCTEHNNTEGEVIIQEGETGHSFYLVLKGGVNVLKDRDGKQHFLSYIGSGGHFGEMAVFMEQAIRTATCIAASNTTTLSIDRATIDRFCLSHPAVGNKIYKAMIKALAHRLQATSADLAMLMGSEVMSQDGVSSALGTYARR